MTIPGSESCTIVFADIAGSTQLYETLGDVEAKSLVTRLQRQIADQASDWGGRVHEIIGDEVMLCFERAADAANCALAIQRMVAGAAADAVPAVRIGMHAGEVLAEGSRLFGDTVNVAARVAAIARGGQIITTDAVVSALPATLKSLARRFDVAPLKGKRDPLLVYDLPWQADDLTEIASLEPGSQTVTCLTLSFAQQQHDIAADGEVFTIGRETGNRLVIDSFSASRRHATIGYVRGRFVITDTSTNGTYVTLQNDQEVFLRRESMPLWGSGVLTLGTPRSEGMGQDIAYRCS